MSETRGQHAVCVCACVCARVQVIKDLCTSNAMEIAGFVTDLHSIQDSAAHVQDLLGQANEVVQVRRVCVYMSACLCMYVSVCVCVCGARRQGRAP